MDGTPRFVIGIDLGTSNSAVSYADLEEVRTAGRPVIHQLEVTQLVAPGDLQRRRLLPSALYEPAGFEMEASQTALPWSPPSAAMLDIVGEGAKRLGAKTPVRLIESAKSWLCHGGVNRTAPILPWHAPDDVPKKSPVEVSSLFLAHMRSAWDREFPDAPMAAQRVVITVPASFDEMARTLTLEAAKRAGLVDLTLIEEPLAAFYAFIARTGGTARTTGLCGGERVLIADVGGGTTDFTLVEVRGAPEEAVLEFERTAVGDHLLLGGDNMDLALAHAIEPDLSKGKKLDAEGWAHLKLECRLAKETLFTYLERDELAIVVAGRGSKLIGGTLRTKLTRAKLFETIVDGYFPAIPPGEAARPQRQKHAAGFSEYGLPYAADPAITRHLAAFLMRHAREGERFAKVDAILFNGGALKPTVIRDRMSEAIGRWMRETAAADITDPRPLVYDDADEIFEVAVARGAAYFGLVREGLGVRVGGGSPREYFLGLGGEAVEPGKLRVVCVAPRGMQDGQRIEVPNREFTLITNRPVQFPLYATTSPRKDPVGSVLDLEADEVDHLPALQTVVKFGKQKAGTPVPVRLQVRRTELGTLELSCLSRMSGARFLLEFDLRSTEEEIEPAVEPGAPGAPAEPFGGAGTKSPPQTGDVASDKLETAKARLDNTFKKDPPREDPDSLMKGLEADLGMPRDEFPLPSLRALGEHLLDLMDMRALSAAIEARWLNVVGFCLRPGWGVPVDDWRVRQLWKIHAQGVLHPGHDPCELNWWILWRRVAGGLARGHQEELAARTFPMLIPALAKRAKKKPPRAKTQEAAEIWRAASSLERISAKSRAQLGDALVEALEKSQAPRGALWCLGRLGSRKLLYGPREATVRADTAADWARRVMKLPRIPKEEDAAACLIALARKTGDRQFDLEDTARKVIDDWLAARGVAEETRRPLAEIVELDQRTQVTAFGEGLPTGLMLDS